TEAARPEPPVLAPLATYRGPVFCVLTKADLVRPKARLLEGIEAWRRARPFHEIVPVSALTGTNCDRLLELVVGTLPEHPAFFPPDTTSDQPDSQKGILIGRGGTMLKRIGTAARRELEAFFGIKVFLELRIDVRRRWRSDDKALREFGFRLTS